MIRVYRTISRRSPDFHRRPLIPLLALALSLSGCVGARRSDAPGPGGGPLVGAVAREAGPRRDPLGEVGGELFTAAPDRSTYVPYGGEFADPTVASHHVTRVGLDAVRSGPGRWRESRASCAGGNSTPVADQILERAADGSVALVETIEHDDGVVTEFAPPMVLLPAALRAATPFRQSLRMTVRPLEDRGRVRMEGPATQEIVFEGTQRVRLGAAGFDASVIRMTLTADLGSVKVRTVTRAWLAPALGSVLEQADETASMLGIPVRTKAKHWALLQPP
ncbi:MAG: hypothetical protein JNM07_10445 [Phycisphaerae bacterium]|nr:hypothetical protein [Phycisphaerae bacterium]